MGAGNLTMAQSNLYLKQEPGAQRSYLKDDFPFVRRALLVLGISLLLSAALIGISRAILLKQQDAMNRAQALRNDASNKLRQAETDKREIQDYQAKYMQLRERGFVGEERRLDWVEHIRHIQESRKFLPIAYAFSAQQPIQTDPGVLTGSLELRGSKMKLQADLLHELDLLNFMDDLKIKGLYTVQACTLKRTGTPALSSVEGAAETPQSPRLAAECTMYWLTLGERTDGQSETSQPGKQ